MEYPLCGTNAIEPRTKLSSLRKDILIGNAEWMEQQDRDIAMGRKELITTIALLLRKTHNESNSIMVAGPWFFQLLSLSFLHVWTLCFTKGQPGRGLEDERPVGMVY